ncbi:MAG: MoaD/ThiS family protein [SAR324 cluster bacterium]|nr:MoaD/ThiS family protein [SAR324 cluster bacterium]
MITVTVKRFINYSSQPLQIVELADGSDAKDLIHKIGLPLAEVGALSINQLQAMLDQKLADGDFVDILPPIGGG